MYSHATDLLQKFMRLKIVSIHPNEVVHGFLSQNVCNKSGVGAQPKAAVLKTNNCIGTSKGVIQPQSIRLVGV